MSLSDKKHIFSAFRITSILDIEQTLFFFDQFKCKLTHDQYLKKEKITNEAKIYAFTEMKKK